MAVAKPVRGLMVVAVVLWCIFLWQMFFRSAPDIHAPGGVNANFDRDPNLDRAYHIQIDRAQWHGLS